MNNLLYDSLFSHYVDAQTTFIEKINGDSVTHGDFVAMSARLANALSSIGLKKGDRVAVQVEKSVESLCVYAACTQAGLVFLPLNTAYTANEIRYFIEDSGARIFICDAARYDSLSEIVKNAGARLETLNEDGSGSLLKLAKTQPNTFCTVTTSPDDLAALLYTSGTTGRSKGAMLTQNNLLSNATTLANHWQFSGADILLHALPIFHTHGLFVAINVSLISGASIIMVPKFNVKTLIDNIPRATCLMGVPTFYTRLLAEPDFDKALVKNMRLFISGSAPLLAETHAEFEQRT